MWDNHIKTNVNNLRVPAMCKLNYNNFVVATGGGGEGNFASYTEINDTDTMHSTSRTPTGSRCRRPGRTSSTRTPSPTRTARAVTSR